MIVERKLRVALELQDLGIALRMQRYRRENPASQEVEIIAMVNEWLQTRNGPDPGADPGATITTGLHA